MEKIKETQHIIIQLTIQDAEGYSSNARAYDTITLNIADRDKGSKACTTAAALLYDSVQVLYDIMLAEKPTGEALDSEA